MQFARVRFRDKNGSDKSRFLRWVSPSFFFSQNLKFEFLLPSEFRRILETPSQDPCSCRGFVLIEILFVNSRVCDPSDGSFINCPEPGLTLRMDTVSRKIQEIHTRQDFRYCSRRFWPAGSDRSIISDDFFARRAISVQTRNLIMSLCNVDCKPTKPSTESAERNKPANHSA